MTVWNDHSEQKVAGDVVFTSKALSIAFSDHAGTHVDRRTRPRRSRDTGTGD
jgi:hypothetical protein